MSRAGVVRLAAVLALGLNATGLLGQVWLRRQLDRTSRVPLESMGWPVGLDRDGKPSRPAARASCDLLRFSSIACGACAADASVYQDLERRCAAAGCASVLLAPSPDELPPAQGQPAFRREVAFVTLETAAALPLSATPTTMILGGDGEVLWSKIGALEADDVQRALRSLRR